MAKKMNVSFKQLLVLIVPLVIIAIYTGFSYSLIVNYLIRSNMRYASSAGMEEATAVIMQELDPPVADLNMIYEVATMSQSPSDLRIILRSAAKQNPIVSEFYFSSLASTIDDGYIVASDTWNPPRNFDQTKSFPWYSKAIQAKGELAATDVYTSIKSGKPTLSISREVYDSTGTAVGIVAFDIDLETLTSSVGEIKITPTSKLNLIQPDGTYVMNFKNPEKIGKANYFTDEGIAFKGNIADYLGENTEVYTKGSKFYSMTQMGTFPCFIVVDGEESDFTAQQKKWYYVIFIVTILLIVANVVVNVIYAEHNKKKEMQLGDKLFGETQNLVVAAKENAATSQDQSAAVKEIVATMEDNTELSSNISEKIKDVSKIANKTSADVHDGVLSLEKNVQKLHEIFDANQTTIDGIKTLGDKIDNIWDIVTIINSVADQAKIIAFNAELEASSAGEAGKNFHIVATEIRRLADGIIDGTKEIKERINEIQTSSDSLILASENGTEKINEEYENAKDLQEKFDSIKNASEVTADSANGITTIIQQQAVASEQILITLKQIASGVENFSTATENISSSAQNLQVIAKQLNEKSYNVDEEEEPKA